MLRDSDETRRVICIGVDRAKPIATCWETICDRLGQDTTLGSSVDPLEECENLGV